MDHTADNTLPSSTTSVRLPMALATLLSCAALAGCFGGQSMTPGGAGDGDGPTPAVAVDDSPSWPDDLAGPGGGDPDADPLTGGAGSGADGLPGGHRGSGGQDAPPEPAPAPEPVPEVVDLRFVAYGEVHVAFDVPVDRDRVSVDLAPARPADLQVVGVRQLDANTLALDLSGYHLPLDYVFSFVTDAGVTDATVDGAESGSRAAFITDASVTGDLVASVDGGPFDTPLAAADGLCQREADAAGLRGQFVAYLGSDVPGSRRDAVCRIRGDEAGCLDGQPTPDSAPLVNPAGMPVAEGANAIAAGLWLAPLARRADGSPFEGGVNVHLGVDDAGVASVYSCDGWTSSSAEVRATAAPRVDDLLLRSSHTLTCDGDRHLACMQVRDERHLPLSDAHRSEGRTAFVTTGRYRGDLGGGPGTGVQRADALCRAEAGEAGLPGADQYVAWLSDGTTDALCHLLGADGKRGNDECGLGQLPDVGPYVRADGTRVARGVRDLLEGGDGLSAPILLDAEGNRGASRYVWTGTLHDGRRANATCEDWTGRDAGTGFGGHTGGTKASWTRFVSGNCAGELHLLCLEPAR